MARTLLVVTILAWGGLLSALRASGPVDPPTPAPLDEEAFLREVSGLAIAERLRAGVPASITAAQAILESDWGRAAVAATGNNYFGIKCKAYWTGATVAHVDDDRDAVGELTESCFRAYASRAESFVDHSEFLLNSERYARLFDIDPIDYRGWARGLKACGYATDPYYADKLIALVERLELYTLDWPEVMREHWLVAMSEPEEPVDVREVRASEFLRLRRAARVVSLRGAEAGVLAGAY